ncbi:MAG: sodium:solute symporter family protein [Candidatus Zixiibacteriota bacterium]
MTVIDAAIIVLYLIGIVVFAMAKRKPAGSSAVDYMLDGRKLTLPAFVATLVCNWYGGILGVGEYSFKYGVSNWLVFGVPYYVAALLFALLLARKARRTEFLTIPDRLFQCYGRHVAGLGALVIFLWTLPTAYILILGVLGESFFGWPKWLGVVLGAGLVTFYAFVGGFRTLVRADTWHFVFMYSGFIIMLIVLVVTKGGYDFLVANAPASHFTLTGGNSIWYIAVWYIIALATLVEPSFFQNCYAARDESTARRGILVSICCWFVFDFLTTTCGIYARAILPAGTDPIASYPLLGQAVLPPGLWGLFAVSMLAVVISTADSYLFIAAATVGKDLMVGWFGKKPDRANFYTRCALIGGALLTVIVSTMLESVVDIWYGFGSVGTPIMLIPLVSTFLGPRRMPPRIVMISMLCSGLASGLWLYSTNLTVDSGYWLSLQPIFPGLIISLLFYLFGSRRYVASEPIQG